MIYSCIFFFIVLSTLSFYKYTHAHTSTYTHLEHCRRSHELKMHFGVLHLSIFFFLHWLHCPSLFLNRNWLNCIVGVYRILTSFVSCWTHLHFFFLTFHCIYSHPPPPPNLVKTRWVRRRQVRYHPNHCCQAGLRLYIPGCWGPWEKKMAQ